MTYVTRKSKDQLNTLHQLGILLLEKAEALKERNRLGHGHSDPIGTLSLIDDITMIIAEIKVRYSELV